MSAEQREVEEGIAKYEASYKKPSRLERELAAVDLVLYEWGRVLRDTADILGYPRVNIVEKFRRERDGASQQGGHITIPDGVMAVDAAVARLKPIRQQVIKVAYMLMPNHPPDAQRRRLRMSRYRWKTLHRESRLLVASYLGMSV